MYKVKHDLAQAIMHDVFQESSNPYNTRQGGDSFKTRNVKTVHYGTQTLAHLGPRIWQQVPNEIKQITELKEFKRIKDMDTKEMSLSSLQNIFKKYRIYLSKYKLIGSTSLSLFFFLFC